SYKNNVEVGEGKIILTGKGNYGGSHEIGFRIDKSSSIKYDKSTKVLTVSGEGPMKFSKMPEYAELAEKLVVEEGITSIADGACYNFEKLQTVQLPKTLTKIGNSAFNNCNSLVNIEIPDAVEHIGENAFSSCWRLKEIELPDSIETIGRSAFSWCNSLEIVNIPKGIKKIDEYAFEGCSMLKAITLPSSIVEIGDYAFKNCSSLESIILSPAIDIGRSIGLNAFRDVSESLVIYCNNEYQLEYCKQYGLTYIDASATYFDDINIENADVTFEYETLVNDANNNKGPKFILKYKMSGNEYVLKYGSDYKYSFENDYVNMKGRLKIRGYGSFYGTKVVDYKIYNYIKDCKIEDLKTDYIYTGSAIAPTFKLSFEGGALKEGEDYVVEYDKKAIEEGNHSFKISGKGDFWGSKVINYTIKKHSIDKVDVALDNTVYVYDGTIKKPVVNVTHNNITLEEGKDYELNYQESVEEGEYNVKVTGINAYKGTKTSEIYKIIRLDISEAKVTLDSSSFIYNGKIQKPQVTVEYDGKSLKENEDYELKYSESTEEGAYEVEILGVNQFKNSVKREYSISKYSIEDTEIVLSNTRFDYDGTPKEPKVTVTYAGNDLKEGEDYEIEYVNSDYVGDAEVVVRGTGKYKGEKNVPYEITPISIEDADFSLNNSVYTYDGSRKLPTVKVVCGGKELVKDQDYSVEYVDNINPGTAKVQVVGIGVYSGAVELSFTILEYSSGMDAVYTPEIIKDDKLLYDISDDDDKEVEVSAVISKKITEIHIPATVKCDGVTYKVTSIGQKAFYKNTKLKKVVVGNNVTHIEDYAFYGCKNITSIKLGKNLDIIGNSSFRKCTKLAEIVIPKSVDTLGKNAFYGCKKLKKIVVNANSVVDISSNALKGVHKKCVIKVPSKLVKKYKKKLKSKTGFKKSMKIKKK
ncbi:MAG: leucine-rich repeat domain-containing protein, partial [Eubacterium sp.]|nr:leucine-rich repeat domain-containing protein [Eubacterium sp.]